MKRYLDHSASPFRSPIGALPLAPPAARAPFTRLLKAFVEKIAFRFPWRSKESARGDSIRMVASLVGALVLSRAVDDEAFSEEILREVRQQLS